MQDRKNKAFMTALMINNIEDAEGGNPYREFITVTTSIDIASSDTRGDVIKCKDLGWDIITTSESNTWFLIETTTRGDNSKVFAVRADTMEKAIADLKDTQLGKQGGVGLVKDIIGVEKLDRDIIIK